MGCNFAGLKDLTGYTFVSPFPRKRTKIPSVLLFLQHELDYDCALMQVRISPVKETAGLVKGAEDQHLECHHSENWAVKLNITFKNLKKKIYNYLIVDVIT